jgi:predicted secreted protein
MAIYYVATPQITVGDSPVDLSDHLLEATLTYEADEIETTSSGTATTTKSYIAGLKSWKVDATFQQDYAASKVDATLEPLVGAAPFAVTLKPTSAAKSATNPEYSGDCILTSYPCMSGKVSELATVKVTFRGTGALGRATV